jgi:hypothetical protein
MLRFALVIYIFMAPGQPVQPIEIQQSTEFGCKQQADKIKADVKKQSPQADVIALCIDKGSAY